VARHAEVDHPARAEFDDEAGEERPEPAVDDLEEVARPGLVGMVPQEGGPGLPAALGPGRARRGHVALDRALAHPETQLEQLAADPLGAPEPVLRRHLLDRRDRLRRHLRALGRAARLGAPDQAEALPMPAQQGLRLHDEQRGAPPAGQARQEDKTEAVCRRERGPPNPALEHHELVAQEGVLGDQGGLRPGQVADRAPDARPGRGPGPRAEATVRRMQHGPGASFDRRRDGPQHALPLSMRLAAACAHATLSAA